MVCRVCPTNPREEAPRLDPGAVHCGALLSAASGVVFEWADVRVTVGLLGLSAITSVIVWWGLIGRGTAGTIPVSMIATAMVGWWFYWPKFGSVAGPDRPAE